MNKKLSLAISTIYLVYFTSIFVLDALCDTAWCRISDEDFLGMIFILGLPLLLIFLFSVITYKMSDLVFQAWWKVAMWFVPIIVVVTFFTNYGHQQSGFGGVAQGAFSFAFLFLLYAAFILTAFIRIILAYRRLKQGTL